MKTGTAAAGLGVVTGVWAFASPLIPGSPTRLCVGRSCTVSAPGTLVLGLVAALILASFACLVLPRRTFYVSAALSALLAASVALDSTLTDWDVVVQLGLALGTVVLSLIAARWEPGVSEQSHPLNLPVFG